jgi:ubiquinone/menaquinone biosynthesis C-methylase UbiE
MPFNKSLGSYSLDKFKNISSELERLTLQTELFKKIEIWVLSKYINSNDKILDLGCGTGITTLEIKKKFPDSTVKGFDLNDNMIGIAKKQLNSNMNIEFKTLDIYEIDTIKERFNFAFSRFLFQHLTNPVLALKKVYEILEPKGKYFIIDVDDSSLLINPNSESLQTFLNKAQKQQSKLGGDRFIGTKLQNYAKLTPFTIVEQNQIDLNSDIIPKEDLLRLVIDYKFSLVSQDEPKLAKKLRDIIYLDMSNANSKINVALHYIVLEKK